MSEGSTTSWTLRVDIPRCIFCRTPLRSFSTIRPGGLPFFWQDCNCDEAQAVSPLWSLAIESLEDLQVAACFWPEGVRVVLSRVLAA